MTLDDLATISPAAVAELAGMRAGTRCGAGVYAAPCPLCSAELAHVKKGRADRRLAVLIRFSGAVTCCSCEVSMSRLDLLTRSRYGLLWGELTRVERAVCLDAPMPAPEPVEPPPARLGIEGWGKVLRVCESASIDPLCVAWAERRGLRLPGGVLAATGTPEADVPLWTAGGLWMPDLGGRLIVPCYDGDGMIQGARVRNVTGGPIKEQAIRGYSATGLVMIPSALAAEWRRGEPASKPCTLIEGTPDRLAAGWAWRERYAIGLFAGSWGAGGTWLTRKRLHEDTVFLHQEDAADKHGHRKGQEYAAKVCSLAPWVRPVGVSAVWRAAGVEWSEGDDLALLAERAEVPGWGW